MIRFSLLALCAAGAAFAQGIAGHNAHGWFMYFGDHQVSKHWGVHLEGQWRRADVVTKPQQLLLRPAVNFHVNPNVMLTAGYGFAQTYRYGDRPAARSFPEHRLYEQLLIKHRTGAVRWQHRFRLEQRFVSVAQDDWEPRQRFRYMLRSDIPLKKDALTVRGPYLGLYDEVFVGYGKNHGAQAFDQNRAYAALGYHFGKTNRFEGGYLHQLLAQRNGIVTEHNHTLQVAFYSNFPFRNWAKGGASR